MTAETINKNINRLYQFYNVDESGRSSFEGHFEPKDLLEAYGRILDWNGAPKSGLSILYLPRDEYLEMEQWLASTYKQAIYVREESTHIDNHGQILQHHVPASFGFLHDGYYWHIQKINS